MPSIQTLLVQVMKDVGAVGKDSRNAQQGFNFRGIDAVVNAVQPALIKHGVIVTPRLVGVEYATITSAKGSEMSSVRGVVAYTFHGPDGDSIEATVAAEAFDSGDKATAKMMSVAFRTALLQALSLPTDDRDPDEDTYERGPSAAEQIKRLKVQILAAMPGQGPAAVKKAMTEYVGHEDTETTPFTVVHYQAFLNSLTGTTAQDQVERAVGGSRRGAAQRAAVREADNLGSPDGAP